MTQQPPHDSTPSPNPRRRTNTLILAVLGGALALIVLIVIVGAIAGGGDDQAATSTPVPSTTSAAALPPPAPAAGPTSTRASGSPIGPSDPRCAPASDSVVGLVQPGLTREGYRLTNGTVISVGGTTYFGASIIDQAGQVKERSDVWVIRNGAVYASTGGARNNTTFPKASAAPLNISPGDELVQAVDTCVVNTTLGR